jgi:ComF family protein
MPKLNKIKNHVNLWRDFLLDLLFPTECLGCGKENVLLCKKCFRNIKINHENYCLNCKSKNNLGNFCKNCQDTFHLNGVWIAGNYKDKLLAKIIKTYKYKFSKNLNIHLGNFMSLYLKNIINKNRLSQNNLNSFVKWKDLNKIKNTPEILLDFSNTLIIPVPLHQKRLNWRGFNQSELLTQVICKNFNLNTSNNLKRTKYTKPQAKLNKTQRENSLRNSFVWDGNNLNKKNIILIDDVATTGSTLNECAKTLKQNGANEVWGLVIANG